jgi:hypothetical protein
VTPQSSRRYSNPPKTYKRRLPHNSPVIKSLFGGNLPLSSMAQKQWVSNIFKPLDMSAIPGYPHNMPLKFEKWFPKFSGNDVTIVEEHLDNFWAFFQLNLVSDDVEDVVMKLFSSTFVDDARRWYNSLPSKSIKTWDDFEETFLKRWGTKEDPNLLLL